MELRFEKYHGIGNDFLVVEADKPDAIGVTRAMDLCRRHFGVGGDGVLVVSPPTSTEARATMTVLNSDGSTPEMCGNGLRCVALHLTRQAGEDVADFLIDTGAGALRCEVKRQGNEGVVATELGLGTILEPYECQITDVHFEFTRVSTGNPHAICFRDQIDDAYLDSLGPIVSERIEGGANVEIATVKERNVIQVAVWERGVGRTLACGTGAAATAIAAVHHQLADPNRPIRVELPGGPLEITVTSDFRARLQGPARWIYSGSTLF